MKNTYFVIDFDSTLVQVEGLDELAAISLNGDPKKDEILDKIKKITNLGMEGSMPIDESLAMRIKLLRANKNHVQALINTLQNKITPSFLRNKEFFTNNWENTFIISSGFKEYIIPIAKKLDLPEKNIFANTFIFSDNGEILGFDKTNTLSRRNGKPEQLMALGLNGDIYAIGDGFTDYQLKESGAATKFFAFTENVERDAVTRNADHIVTTFDEFLHINNIPSAAHPKNKLKVLLLENVHPCAVSMLKENEYDVETLPKTLLEEELCRKIEDISILGIRSKTQITQKVIGSANKLMAIGAFGVGTNQIDIDACTRKGIVVFNAPFSSTRSVVELAMGEMIMLMRNAFDKSMNLHKGIWDKSSKNSHEVRGKKLGIIGYGNIGSQLSVLAESFGMEVHYYDAMEKLAMGNAKRCTTLQELLKKCDVISMHVDGTAGNKNLISEKEFDIMKHGAIILNLSRGSTIDLDVLVKYIKDGRIRGAGLDVFPKEPQGSSGEFVSELRGLPNVILTPHLGGSTEEAQQNIGDFVTRKLIDFVNNGNTSNSVNFPNINLPKLSDAHRLIHVHENVPGVLSKINAVIAGNNINIVGQYLKTNDKIGYVITDISKKYEKKVLNELKNIEHTINFRVLY